MTKQREFKALVRERMTKTGERYTAARAQLLTHHTQAQGQPSQVPIDTVYPGVLGGYTRFGGIQGDTAAVSNALRQAGVLSPLTGEAHTEVMINGLCGGPGFLYAVFEYKGWPPMLSLALRSRSMDDAYITDGLPRLGIRVTESETTSASVARKALDAALAAGKAALCVTDLASLPWYGLPAAYIGGAPRVIAVAGREDDAVWIDDRSTRPIRMSVNQLADARARYRAAKQRLMTIDGALPAHDPKAALRDAIATTARRYTEPAVPKSFWANCGFAGLHKWQQLLTDRKDKKGWPTVFSDGARAYAALQRAYECCQGPSGPDGGRALYADFLDEASAALNQSSLKKAAVSYREAATSWAQAAALVAGAGDAALRQACEISDRRFELADAHGDGISEEASALWQRRHKLAGECTLTKDAALALYTDLANVVGRIIESEQAAVTAMTAAR